MKIFSLMATSFRLFLFLKFRVQTIFRHFPTRGAGLFYVELKTILNATYQCRKETRNLQEWELFLFKRDLKIEANGCQELIGTWCQYCHIMCELNRCGKMWSVFFFFSESLLGCINFFADFSLFFWKQAQNFLVFPDISNCFWFIYTQKWTIFSALW